MVGALAAAAVLIAAFGLIERRVVEPIIPFDLLRNQTVASSVACMALVGAAMFGTISFVPLFVQGVIGTSATLVGRRPDAADPGCGDDELHLRPDRLPDRAATGRTR